ncbi:MAG: methyl-accepting chemotaxis protein [Clostridiales bacterium]|nr:methyl-accepting chemotaxis protein [Clostridiales bacterium]
MALNYLDAQASSNSNKKMAQLTFFLMAAVVLIGVAVAMILRFVLTRLIGKPVAHASKIADLLAAGNLDMEQLRSKEIDELKARGDEVGDLMRSFDKLVSVTVEQAKVINQVEQGDLTIDVEVRSENDLLGKSLSGLVNNLSDLTSGIMAAADQVASGAQLVSNSSMALSQGATEQASSVQELTASLEQISAQTSLNAQNAEKASRMATEAKTEAEQGNAQMNALLKAMDAINASSNNINKVIKVIDDIAFQTNILALNAAVEAARAGQHGKGFAVVAEEVRTLAGKSANAVKDTTEMIDGSIRNVESGIKIANETAEALKRIVTEVTNATELVGSIAVASKEQALGIEQLNQGIIQVSLVVQNNAATSEESAAASEELSSQADQLKEVVSVFKVKNSSADTPSKLSAASVRAPSQARALPSGKPRTKIELEGDFGKY